MGLQTLCPLRELCVHAAETFKAIALLIKYLSGMHTRILCQVRSATQVVFTNYCFVAVLPVFIGRNQMAI